MTKWYHQYKSSYQLSNVEIDFYGKFKSYKHFNDFMKSFHGYSFYNYQLESNKPTLSDTYKWHRNKIEQTKLHLKSITY